MTGRPKRMAEPRPGAPRMEEPEQIVSLDRDPLAGALQSSASQPSEPSEPDSQEESRVEPQAQDQPKPSPGSQPGPQPRTLDEMFDLVDDGWRQFFRAAAAFPSERMDERLNDGWTRKQMLAHISAWHDLTHDRLGKLILTGEAAVIAEDADAINARVARQAIGRTAGETLNEMEMTFNRLRRQLGRLIDEQLAAHDGWAARCIASNTYEHYEEHRADVYQAPAPASRSGRR